MTVSMALRNDPRIKEETRLRIQETAEKLGYIPDPALSALSAYRREKEPRKFQGTLAWLNPTRQEDAHRQWPTLKQFFEGAKRQATKLGYKLETIHTQSTERSAGRLTQILQTRGIKGLILQPGTLTDPVPEIDYRHFSVVRLGDYTTRPRGFDLVAADHVWAMRQVLQKITEKNYQRVAYVTNAEFEERLNHLYLGTYLGQLERKKERLLPPYLFTSPAKFKHWYRQTSPQAIILPNSLQVIPCLEALKAMKVQIPEDLGVCFTCMPEKADRDWSGVDENLDLIGATAVNTLVANLNRWQYGLPTNATNHLVHGTWREGNSLPDASPKESCRQATSAASIGERRQSPGQERPRKRQRSKARE
jgi:LacI family transcriptional regulator